MAPGDPPKGSRYEDWHPGELERLPEMIRKVQGMMNPQARSEEIDEMIQHEREKYADLDLEERIDGILFEDEAVVESGIEVPEESVAEIRRVVDERIRQDDVWGTQRVSLAEWGLILGEEVGEAIHAATQLHFGYPKAPVPGNRSMIAERQRVLRHLRIELCQTAAVAISWMEHVSEMIQDLEDEEDRRG